MNRTLMLIICDFLLLSMLALVDFKAPDSKIDRSGQAASRERQATQEEEDTPKQRQQTTVEKELIALLEDSLQAEEKTRSNVSEDLRKAQRELEEKAKRLEEREDALESSRRNIRDLNKKAEELSASKASVEEEKERIAQERAELSEKFADTREQLESVEAERRKISEDLGNLENEKERTRERLGQTEEALAGRDEALSEREKALKEARDEKERLAEEREQLRRRLEQAERERIRYAENLEREQEERERLQQEKEQAFAHAERLSENFSVMGESVSQLDRGVEQLAQNSRALRDDIESSRPRTMSEIFTRFQNNRALIRFNTRETTLFGGIDERSYESQSALIAGKDGAYLVTHIDNTPFSLRHPSNNPQTVDLEIEAGEQRVRPAQIGFFSNDPRMVFIPLPKSAVEASNLEVFELARQPEHWEEAVLIKQNESNFGSTGFRRLTESQDFLRMERPALGRFFSEFASSKGDLAFSKNNKFIGLLTGTKHSVVIDSFLASAVLDLGSDYDRDEARKTLERLQNRLRKLPAEVR